MLELLRLRLQDVPWVAHSAIMVPMRWRTFGGLIPRGRSIDAWATLCTGKGVDHSVGRAHQPVLHRGRRLDRQPFLHQWCIQAAAKLGEHFWKYKMCLGAIHLDRSDPTAIHHRQVGSQPATNLCIRAGQLLFQEFQRQPHSRRDGRASPRGGFGEAPGERAVHGRDQGRPRERVGPLAEGMRFGDKVWHLEAHATSG